MNAAFILKQILKPEQLQRLTIVSAKAFAPVTRVGHAYGPEILTGTGIVAGVTATVLAAKATLKLENTLDYTRSELERLDKLGDVVADGEAAIDPASIKRDIARVKIRGALSIAKLYIPAVTVGIGAIGCVLAAHGIMRRRNVALVAAYNALQQSFEAYRKRVVDEFGKEKDEDFHLGFHTTEKTDKDGVVKTQTRVGPHSASVYAQFFDEGNENWVKTHEYNLMFLKMQQDYANNLLKARGYLFLSEVYKVLGFETTQAAQVVGWTWGGDGDNYVDFKIWDLDDERKRAFVNGKERNILLDFNVDGLIIDKIKP